jgi:hypothetical protein
VYFTIPLVICNRFFRKIIERRVRSSGMACLAPSMEYCYPCGFQPLVFRDARAPFGAD